VTPENRREIVVKIVLSKNLGDPKLSDQNMVGGRP